MCLASDDLFDLYPTIGWMYHSEQLEESVNRVVF